MGIYCNIDMPISCEQCPVILYGMGDIICGITKDRILNIKERLRSCPLVEVKKPHGNLIDIDEVTVTEDVYNQIFLIHAQTIIEAEGES